MYDMASLTAVARARRPPALAVRILLLVSGAKLLLHLALANRYGYFRDELYFLDCGRHLDWGYVDHAPMIGLVARLALLLGARCRCCGASPRSLARGSWPSTMLIAWRLGGGRFAQGLAGLALLVVPSTWAWTAC